MPSDLLEQSPDARSLETLEQELAANRARLQIIKEEKARNARISKSLNLIRGGMAAGHIFDDDVSAALSESLLSHAPTGTNDPILFNQNMLDQKLQYVVNLGLNRGKAAKEGSYNNFLEQTALATAKTIAETAGFTGEIVEHVTTGGLFRLGQEVTDRLPERYQPLAAAITGLPTKKERESSRARLEERNIGRSRFNKIYGGTLDFDENGSFVTDLQFRLEQHPSLVRDLKEAILTKVLGFPEDQIQRQLYEEEFNPWARTAGNLAGIVAMIALTRRWGAVPKPTLVGAGAKTGGLLSRTPGGLAAGLGTAGAGLGVASDVWFNPNSDAWSKFQKGTEGLGIGVFLGTFLQGKPYGPAARSIIDAERTGALGSLAKLGNSLRSSPNITLGFQMQSGAIGAAMTAGSLNAQGMPAGDAILEGLKEGAAWIGTDAIASGVGGLVRWQRTLTNLEGNVVQTLREINQGWAAKFANFKPAQAAATVGASSGLGAVIGAGSALASDTDVRTGAIYGAIAGGIGIPSFFHRTGSILPKSIVKAFIESDLRSLKPNEVGKVAGAILTDAVFRTAIETNDLALLEVLLHTVKDGDGGGLAFMKTSKGVLAEEAAIMKEINKLYQEFHKRWPNETMPTNPNEMVEFGQMSGRLQELNQLRVNALQNRNFPETGNLLRHGEDPKHVLMRLSIDNRNLSNDAIDLRSRAVALRAAREAGQAKRKSTIAGKKLANEVEEQLDFTGESNRVFNEDQRVAKDLIENLSLAEVYREISLGTGETLDVVKNRLGHTNIAAAVEELSYLRAQTGLPRQRLAKIIDRRTGLSTEHRANLDKYQGILATVSDVLQRGDLSLERRGQTLLILRNLLKKYGGTVTKADRGMVTLKLPLIDEITDTLPAALRKARQYLLSLRPGLMLGGIATTGVLSSASQAEAAEGLIPHTDEQGNDVWSWMADNKGILALGGLGMLMTKGFPVRGASLATALQRALKNSTEKFDREMLISFLSEGRVSITRGGNDAVSVDPLLKDMGDAKDYLLGFSVHNHTTARHMLEKTYKKASKLERKRFLTGATLANINPSPQDIFTLGRASFFNSRTNRQYVVGAVLTPLDTFTGFVIPRSEIPFTVGKDGVSTINVKAWSAKVNQLKDEVRNVHSDMLAAVGGSGKSTDLIIGRYAELFGLPETLNKLSSLYPKVFPDMVITHNMTGEQLERAVLSGIHDSQRRVDPMNVVRALDADAAILDPIAGEIAKKAFDKSFKDKLRKLAGIDTTKPLPEGARKVAPAVAREYKRILPESVTPQAATMPSTSLESMIPWGLKHNLQIKPVLRDGSHEFAVLGPTGQEIVRAPNLRALKGEIFKLAKADSVGQMEATIKGTVPNPLPHFTKESGRYVPDLGARVAAGAVGSLGILPGTFIGNQLDKYLYDDSDNQVRPFATILGMVGFVGGAIGMASLAGFGLNKLGRQALLFHTPLADEFLTPAQVARTIGRSSGTFKDKKGKVIRASEGGPSKNEFAHYPVGAQLTHLGLRLKATSDTKNATPEQLANRLHNLLRKFAPTHFPDAASYDQLRAQVMDTARGIGMLDVEGLKLWRGLLIGMATSTYKSRSRGRLPDLFVMSTTKTTQFGAVEDITKLRQVAMAAHILSGLDTDTAPYRVRAAAENIRQYLTPESQILKAIRDVADRSDVSATSQDTTRMARLGGVMLGSLLPTERFRSIGRKWLDDPEKVGQGRMLLRAYESIMLATAAIKVDGEKARLELMTIFKGVAHEDFPKFRRVLEDPAYRDEVMKNNRTLYDKIYEYDALLKSYAIRLGLEPQQFVEDYYPWVFSTRTLSELKKTGQIPDKVLIPVGSGIQEHVIMRHFIGRKGETPRGKIIDDPLEAAQIYLNAAVRKEHLDKVLAIADDKFYKELSEVAPFIAVDLAKWQLAVFGIPTLAQVGNMVHMQTLGLHLEKIAAGFGFNSPEFLEKTIDRYFLGPGAIGKFSNFVRGAEFYSKIGGSFISSLINSTQLVANTGTDLGLIDLFVGGITFSAKAAQGRIAEIGGGKAYQAALKAAGGLDKVGTTTTSQLKKTVVGTAGGAAGGAVAGDSTADDPIAGAAIGAAIGAGTSFYRAGFIDPKLQGAKKLQLARSIGVWSDNTRRYLDQMEDVLSRDRGWGVGTIVGGGAATGIAGSIAFGGDDEERGMIATGSRALGFGLPGAIVGSGVIPGTRKWGPKLISFSLQKTRDTLIAPFSTVEAVNRSMAAGGAQRSAKKAREFATFTPGQKTFSNVKQAVGEAAIGASAGGLFFSQQGDLDNRTKNAVTGALVGATVGAGTGIGGFKKNRLARIGKELEFLDTEGLFIAGLKKFVDEGPPTIEEVEKVYMRQVLDMTQFRFGKEARAAALRSPMGEIAGALQSFTLNQIEFAGSRIDSFWTSVGRQVGAVGETQGAANLGKGLAKDAFGGELDTRIFRHAALVAGMGGALTALTFQLDSDHTPMYWLSRVGFGLLPMVSYNENAETWQLNELGQHFTGSFANDVFNATRTAWFLMFDERARYQWDQQLDRLSQQIFAALRQLPKWDEVAGESLMKLKAERTSEMIRGTSDTLDRIANPVSAAAGNTVGETSRPAPVSRQASNRDRRIPGS